MSGFPRWSTAGRHTSRGNWARTESISGTSTANRTAGRSRQTASTAEFCERSAIIEFQHADQNACRGRSYAPSPVVLLGLPEKSKKSEKIHSENLHPENRVLEMIVRDAIARNEVVDDPT